MSSAPPARRGIESENTSQHAPDKPSLAASVRRGALWSLANTVLLKVASLAITAVVARILSPRDFGVFTVAITAYAIVSSIGELGVSSCLIRADLDIDRLAPTMVTVSVVTSAVQAAAMVFFARPIASALGSPDAAQPIRVMALVVIIVGCFAVPSAQLVRNFRQEKLFLAEAISFVFSTAVLILLAKRGSGAMAFAWSRVAGQLVSGCVLALSAPRTYRPGLRRSALRLLTQVGFPLGAANIIGFILLNVDYGLIGHLLGAVALGVYVLAFNVASWPSSLLGAMINNVSMPAFSRVKNDPELLKSAITDAVRAISLVVMPISALTVALADPLVLTLYGSKWSQSARILQLLALYGAFSILCVLFSNILAGLGRTKLLFVMQLYWLVALVPAMVLGVHYDGVVGAALAHVIVIGPIILPFYVLTLMRMTGIRLGALARAVLPSLLVASAAALAARETSLLLMSTPLAALLAGGVAGGLIYAVATAPQAIAILNRGQGGRVRGQRILDLYQSGARLLGLPSGRQPKHSARRPVQLDVPYGGVSGAEPTAAELLAMARSTEVIQTGAAAFEVLMSLARPAPVSPAFAMIKQTPGDVTTPLERFGIGR
jgi:PST family polysaccharide transporter